MNQEKDEYLKNLKQQIIRLEYAIKRIPELQLKTDCIFNMYGKDYDIRKMNQFELRMMLKMFELLDWPSMKLGNFTVRDFCNDILNLLDENRKKIYEEELNSLNEKCQNRINQNQINKINKNHQRNLSNLLGF